MDMDNNRILIDYVGVNNGETYRELLCYENRGQGWQEYDPVSSSHQNHSMLTSDLAISGNYAASMGLEKIIIYKYNNLKWTHFQTLPMPKLPNKSTSNIWKIAMDGDLLVMSDPIGTDHRGGAGLVHVYQRGPEGFTDDLYWTINSPANTRNFGWDVDVNNGRILVGARDYTDPDSPENNHSGNAHLYEFLEEGEDQNPTYSWVKTFEFSAEPEGLGERFGMSVALHQGKAVIGTRHSAVGPYLFWQTENGWKRQPYDDRLDQIHWSLGSSVAINHDTAILGAPLQQNPDAHTGAVIAWDISALTSSQSDNQIIRNVDFETGRHFGHALAADGKYLLVGTLGYGEGPEPSSPRIPSVVLFEKKHGTWVEILQIEGEESAWPEGIRGMDIADNRLLIDYVSLDQSGNTSRKLLSYENRGTGWREFTPISNPHNDPTNMRGDVSISGNYAVSLGGEVIRVLLHDGNTWDEKQTLQMPVLAKGKRSQIFNVALDGDLLVMADHFGSDDSGADGHVFVYQRIGETFPETPTWTLTSPAEAVNFGNDIAVDNGRILVSAGGYYDIADPENGHSGNAHLFELVSGSWERVQLFSGEAEDPFEGFGSSVALVGKNVVVGTDHPLIGGAYLFQETENGWEKQTYEGCRDDDNWTMGSRVAVNHDTAFLGVPLQENANAHTGAVIAWDISDDVPLAHLTSPVSQDKGDQNRFGKKCSGL